MIHSSSHPTKWKKKNVHFGWSWPDIGWQLWPLCVKQWLSAVGQRSSSVAAGSALRWAKCATRFETVLTGVTNPSRNAVSENVTLSCYGLKLSYNCASEFHLYQIDLHAVDVNHVALQQYAAWNAMRHLGDNCWKERCKYATWQLNYPF